jgi:hypothetical protein
MAQRHDVVFQLHGQTRTYPFEIAWKGDTLQVMCNKTIWQMPRKCVDTAVMMNWQQPVDGERYILSESTAFIISNDALQRLRQQGWTVYGGWTWRVTASDTAAGTLHLKADIDDVEMWVEVKENIPLIVRMKNNPLGIDWNIK